MMGANLHEFEMRRRHEELNRLLDEERWEEIDRERERIRQQEFISTFCDPEQTDALNPAGWPRPVLQSSFLRTASSGASTDRWPTPWISQMVTSPEGPKSALKDFDRDRRVRSVESGLCQVCGTSCEQVAYAPVLASDLVGHRAVHVSGSPVCSVRCSKLAIAMCPHFADEPALISFELETIEWSGESFEFSVSAYEVMSLSPS